MGKPGLIPVATGPATHRFWPAVDEDRQLQLAQRRAALACPCSSGPTVLGALRVVNSNFPGHRA